MISHRGENPAGHSETKTVQGRQAACIDYPPTSARDTEAPGKPGLAQGHTARAGRAQVPEVQSSSFAPQPQSLTRTVFRLNTGSEPGCGPCQVLLGHSVWLWLRGQMRGRGFLSPGVIRQGSLERVPCEWVLNNKWAFPRGVSRSEHVGKGSMSM